MHISFHSAAMGLRSIMPRDSVKGMTKWSGPAVRAITTALDGFLVECKIDVSMMKLIGVKGHLFSLRGLISNCKAGGEMSAGDWKFFFSLLTWLEVCELFGNLHDGKG